MVYTLINTVKILTEVSVDQKLSHSLNDNEIR